MVLQDIEEAYKNVACLTTKTHACNVFHADENFVTIEHGIKDIRPNEEVRIEDKKIDTSIVT